MSCAGSSGRQPPVQVAGRSITVAGQPIYIKGVAWNPYATGRSPDAGDAQDFAGFVGTDAPLMAAAGINVVRTYAPLTDSAVLDVLWSHGIFVINTVFYDSGYGHDSSTALAAVCAVKSHPAILMWSVANEPNYFSVSTTYLSDIASVVDSIQAADASRPVAVVWGEVAPTSVLSALPAVDVWAFNVYRGTSFNDLWTAWLARSEKPFFLAEYGTDSFSTSAGTSDFTMQANEVRLMASEVASQAATSANSVSRFSRSFRRSARESSPTSSTSHANVSNTPRSRSRSS